jgi:hypothetical protein
MYVPRAAQIRIPCATQAIDRHVREIEHHAGLHESALSSKLHGVRQLLKKRSSAIHIAIAHTQATTDS